MSYLLPVSEPQIFQVLSSSTADRMTRNALHLANLRSWQLVSVKFLWTWSVEIVYF